MISQYWLLMFFKQWHIFVYVCFKFFLTYKYVKESIGILTCVSVDPEVSEECCCTRFNLFTLGIAEHQNSQGITNHFVSGSSVLSCLQSSALLMLCIKTAFIGGEASKQVTIMISQQSLFFSWPVSRQHDIVERMNARSHSTTWM